MDSALDFSSRARFAWKQFRNPSGLDPARHVDPVRDAEEAHTSDTRPGVRRESTWPLDPVEGGNPLNEFRLLVGIHQHETFRAPHG